jgi:hypothetical protein
MAERRLVEVVGPASTMVLAAAGEVNMDVHRMAMADQMDTDLLSMREGVPHHPREALDLELGCLRHLLLHTTTTADPMMAVVAIKATTTRGVRVRPRRGMVRLDRIRVTAASTTGVEALGTSTEEEGIIGR